MLNAATGTPCDDHRLEVNWILAPSAGWDNRQEVLVVLREGGGLQPPPLKATVPGVLRSWRADHRACRGTTVGVLRSRRANRRASAAAPLAPNARLAPHTVGLYGVPPPTWDSRGSAAAEKAEFKVIGLAGRGG